MTVARARTLAPTIAALALCLMSPAAAQEPRMVPVTVDGQTVRLQMRVYRPATDGLAPTLVFNHGSTGSGREPGLFTRTMDFPALARFFVARGWAVVMPMRRGRGGSEGEYDEGFASNRADGYTCEAARSIPGAERALRDIDAALEVIFAMPFVDATRVLIGGQSRGGVLSVAYAGAHPERVKGVINFVGGWLGSRCPTSSAVNGALFERGGRYPGEMLWLYGDADPFYPLSHSRANVKAFRAAGGRAAFHELLPPAGLNGHLIVTRPDLWQTLVDDYLRRIGLPGGPP
jgi:dienelactone hydrolase